MAMLNKQMVDCLQLGSSNHQIHDLFDVWIYPRGHPNILLDGKFSRGSDSHQQFVAWSTVTNGMIAPAGHGRAAIGGLPEMFLEDFHGHRPDMFCGQRPLLAVCQNLVPL